MLRLLPPFTLVHRLGCVFARLDVLIQKSGIVRELPCGRTPERMGRRRAFKVHHRKHRRKGPQGLSAPGLRPRSLYQGAQVPACTAGRTRTTSDAFSRSTPPLRTPCDPVRLSRSQGPPARLYPASTTGARGRPKIASGDGTPFERAHRHGPSVSRSLRRPRPAIRRISAHAQTTAKHRAYTPEIHREYFLQPCPRRLFRPTL